MKTIVITETFEDEKEQFEIDTARAFGPTEIGYVFYVKGLRKQVYIHPAAYKRISIAEVKE